MAGSEWNSPHLDPGWLVASCMGSLSPSLSICKMRISGAFTSQGFERCSCHWMGCVWPGAQHWLQAHYRIEVGTIVIQTYGREESLLPGVTSSLSFMFGTEELNKCLWNK